MAQPLAHTRQRPCDSDSLNEQKTRRHRRKFKAQPSQPRYGVEGKIGRRVVNSDSHRPEVRSSSDDGEHERYDRLVGEKFSHQLDKQLSNAIEQQREHEAIGLTNDTGTVAWVVRVPKQLQDSEANFVLFTEGP